MLSDVNRAEMGERRESDLGRSLCLVEAEKMATIRARLGVAQYDRIRHRTNLAVTAVAECIAVSMEEECVRLRDVRAATRIVSRDEFGSENAARERLLMLRRSVANER